MRMYILVLLVILNLVKVLLSLDTTSASMTIWLVVRVTVLSEQMTVQHSDVSTEGSLRTMELRLTIFLVPRARQSVMTASSPSGMAATHRATAILR